MKFQAIGGTVSPLSITDRCTLLEVSRSGFYARRGRPPSARAVGDGVLVGAIRQIHAEVDRSYGSPRVHRELVARGFRCGRRRTARVMRAAGIQGKQTPRYRVTTDSQHEFPVAPNLVARDFTVPAPNRLWMGDVTFIPTGAGWCYLAVLLDAWSRRVVGWALGPELTTALPLAALERALTQRAPPPGLVHHSDRGSQYASVAYQAVLQRYGVQPSMSRAGDCWDNAVVESFFHTLKVERVYDRRYADWQDARQDIADYIERFYNRQRRHSTLGYLSPATFELQNVA